MSVDSISPRVNQRQRATASLLKYDFNVLTGIDECCVSVLVCHLDLATEMRAWRCWFAAGGVTA
jgi:hypothetical protein